MKYAKHFLPFLALLLTLTLFLSACEQKGGQPTAEPQTYYDVYRLERLALPEGFVYEDHLRSCGNYIYFECRSETEQTGSRQEVFLDEAFTQKVYGEISGAHLLGAGDDTVSAIIDEEFSYAQQGVRTFEEAAKLIQNRVSIYLAEHSN